MPDNGIVRNPFEYQKPGGNQIVQIEEVRQSMRATYTAILENVPPSAERTLAIRKLEEASMWANKAIVFDGERYI
jgi:hypothetical protein